MADRVFYHRRSERDLQTIVFMKIIGAIALAMVAVYLLWSSFGSGLTTDSSDPAFGSSIVVNADHSLTITERQSLVLSTEQPLVLTKVFPLAVRGDAGEEINLRYLFTAGSIISFNGDGQRRIQNVTPEATKTDKIEKVVVSSGLQNVSPGTYVVELEYTVLGAYQGTKDDARVRWNITRNELQGRFALRLSVAADLTAIPSSVRGQLLTVSRTGDGSILRKPLVEIVPRSGGRPTLELERVCNLQAGESLVVDISWKIK